MTIREKVARAICLADFPGGCVPGCVHKLDGGRCAYAAAADAALAALPCSVEQLEQIAKGEAMVTLSKDHTEGALTVAHAFERFAEALKKCGAPPPWNHGERPGEIVNASGCSIIVHDPNGGSDEAFALAAWIICAVNTCAGFKVEPLRPDHKDEQAG